MAIGLPIISRRSDCLKVKAEGRFIGGFDDLSLSKIPEQTCNFSLAIYKKSRCIHFNNKQRTIFIFA